MMPLEMGGVVSPDLRVHGIERLSVVDASIMPLAPATHLDATVYAVAEKVGLLILPSGLVCFLILIYPRQQTLSKIERINYIDC
jgi:choline dehydrogenase-like flavoprotein